MSITSATFGQLNNGKKVKSYTLLNKNNMEVSIIDYGATIQSIKIPKSLSEKTDIVLGYDDLDNYIKDKGNYFGATVGRNSNRIKDARFVIDSVIYTNDKNNGENNLHSGYNGFNSSTWELDKELSDFEKNILTLKILSPHLAQGFPGNLIVKITFKLNDNNELSIVYKGWTDLKTIFNPTNHSYFNLNGHSSGNILEKHLISINAKKYTITDENLIPTGEIENVHGKFDLQSLDVLKNAYDDNFIVNHYEPYELQSTDKFQNSDVKDIPLTSMAKAIGIESNIELEIISSMPAIQLYTGEFINSDGLVGKSGTKYHEFAGFCFETQFYPDSINQDDFPSPLIETGKKYVTKTIFKFKF